MSYTLIAIAAFIAGVINSMAGGGTLVSFPTMVWLGRPPIMANATNAVALWPGSLSAMFGYRDDMRRMRRWLFLLTIPSVAGGALGAILLLHTTEKTFTRIIPFLILGATLLLAAQELISRKLNLIAKAHEKPTTGWVVFVFTFQLLVGLYGGYFGAGMGILMLAALGLIGLTDLHGHGDRCLGLTVPMMREIVRDFRELPLAGADALLASPWHEDRLVALMILVEQYRRTPTARAAIYRLYLGRTDRINNWDLVD